MSQTKTPISDQTEPSGALRHRAAPSQARGADLPVALVLGARVRASGEGSPPLKRRVRHAIELWQKGQVSALILSGGGGGDLTEAEAMARLCRAAGLPGAALYLETQARSTAENLRLAKPILDRLGQPPLILVTDRWHLPRAETLARRLGMTVTGSAPQSSARRRPGAVLRERAARLIYWLTLWR